MLKQWQEHVRTQGPVYKTSRWPYLRVLRKEICWQGYILTQNEIKIQKCTLTQKSEFLRIGVFQLIKYQEWWRYVTVDANIIIVSIKWLKLNIWSSCVEKYGEKQDVNTVLFLLWTRDWTQPDKCLFWAIAPAPTLNISLSQHPSHYKSNFKGRSCFK